MEFKLFSSMKYMMMSYNHQEERDQNRNIMNRMARH